MREASGGIYSSIKSDEGVFIELDGLFDCLFKLLKGLFGLGEF